MTRAHKIFVKLSNILSFLMENNPKKARSKRTKKRKGFPGKKAWEVAKEKQKTPKDPQSVPRNQTGSGNGDGQQNDSDSEIEDLNLENGIESPEKRNVSAEKLLNSSFLEIEEETNHITRTKAKYLGLNQDKEKEKEAHGFKLQDATLLSECISDACICSSCRDPNSKLRLLQDDTKRDGLAESLYLKCSQCESVTPLSTSRKLGGQGGGAHEVNRRSVIAAHQWGRAGLSKFCGKMDLPPPVTSNAYNKQLKQVKNQSVRCAEELMCQAAERLHTIRSKEEPENIKELNDGVTVADVAVTVDGTWQKRGHTSKIGVVFVISVRTGEILDCEVKALICPECTAHKTWDKHSQNYLDWKVKHNPVCEINHDGSSGAMEAKAAVEMFERSIEKRRLRYTLFVGDGDSSCFGSVKDAMKDIYNVEKEECVGHVQKRMGSSLKTFKTDHKGKRLADGKPVGGKGRLTESVTNSMQNYYGLAIRNNKGNLQGMKNSIWAIYYHMISPEDEETPVEEQHRFCPKDENTWCKFWFDKLHNKTDNLTYDTSKRLPSVFRTDLKDIFVRLSNDKLLSRCLRGMTQNQNEAVNCQLWSKCPKTRFCGKRRVTVAVCETVAVFNTGEAGNAIIMRGCGVPLGINTMQYLRKQDKIRLANAKKKVSSRYRKKRKGQRAKAKARVDKNSYNPGSFDLTSKPTSKKYNKRKTETEEASTINEAASTSQTTQNYVDVAFVTPDFEVVHQPSAAKRARLQ